MTNTALAEFYSDIAALGWVEVYGGATKTLFKDQHKNQKGLIYFPVTTSISEADCWNEGIYKMLVPDEKKKSLLYFEESKQFVYSKNKIEGETYTSEIKMVCWVNVPQLGLDHTTNKVDFVNSLRNIFGSKQVTSGGKVSLKLLSVDNEVATQSFFNKYNYNNVNSILYYPFITITMNCEIKVMGNIGCVQELVTAEPIACKNLAYE